MYCNINGIELNYEIIGDGEPILMLNGTGRQEATVGYRDQFKMLKWFPRATYIALDKSGHIPQIEQEVIFNTLVKEWLVRVIEERGLSD